MLSLTSAISTTNSDIICLQETMLESNRTPNIKGYKWITKMRDNKKGGGTAILVKEQIANKVKTIDIDQETSNETLWIAINIKGKQTIIGNVYGPQENEKRQAVKEIYRDIRRQILKLKDRGPVILVGDFNAKLEIQVNENKIQNISPNGKIMEEEIIKGCNMYVKNQDRVRGMWTRQNRTIKDEKSIIDYILIQEKYKDLIQNMEIDEEGSIRIKGKNETDHNTITATIQVAYKEETKKEKKLKINNKQGWKDFNKEIEELHKKKKLKTSDEYNSVMRIITETMRKNLGTYTKTNKRKPKESDKTKTLRIEMKKRRREFNQACKTGDSTEKMKTKEEYIKGQIKLRNSIEYDEKEVMETKINDMIKEGGTKGTNFWKIRKRLLKDNNIEYDLITEENTTINEPDKAKEYIANYYENLYQAREEKPNYKPWTKIIKEKNQELSKRTNQKTPITIKELKNTIKRLKRNKAIGPDGIPNELFIEANNYTIKILLEILNKVHKTGNIPEIWNTGTVTTIYKGKGKKGKCSNERGITVANNIGKIYERIIDNRSRQQVTITEAQAGGMKGKATADHLLILKELINNNKKRKKPILLTFLDVTKAYDKAWIDAILYVLDKRGLKSEEWEIVKELNTNLTSTIKTKYGHTRRIRMANNIRQGGVLSVLMYAALMDEIAEAINKEKEGIIINSKTELTIGSLLWVDDVVLISENPEQMQRMLNITNEIANRYRIEFGKEKSKVVKINWNKPTKLKLGDMEIEETEQYKYLGEIINTKGNLLDHISMIERKVESAYQTILYIAKDENFKKIKMATIWKLIESCIVPIITYGAEARIASKEEEDKLQTILNKILKRTIKVPISTPNDALTIETGIPDIKTLTDIAHINNYNRIQQMDDDSNTKEIVINSKRWNKEIERIKESYQINNTQEAISKGKNRKKEQQKNMMYEKLKENIENRNKGKTKMEWLMTGKSKWKPGTRANYLNELTRKQCKIIFETRTRMIKVKGNYKNKEENTKCGLCNTKEETQEHILEECVMLIEKEQDKITKKEIFCENTQSLIETAKRIEERLNIRDRLNNINNHPPGDR